MRDSSTGIKLTRNLEQGNRYKETFTGMPAADKDFLTSDMAHCRDKGATALAWWWDQLWPAGKYWCSWILQHLSFLLCGYMEAYIGPHSFSQPCTSLTAFVMVPKCFVKGRPVMAGDISLTLEEWVALVWELPFSLQALPWWTGSSPTTLLCHGLRLSPWPPCWWRRTSPSPWEPAALRPCATATSQSSSSTTPPRCTCL